MSNRERVEDEQTIIFMLSLIRRCHRDPRSVTCAHLYTFDQLRSEIERDRPRCKLWTSSDFRSDTIRSRRIFYYMVKSADIRFRDLAGESKV